MTDALLFINGTTYAMAAAIALVAVTRVNWPYNVPIFCSLIVCGYFGAVYMAGFVGLITSAGVTDWLRPVSFALPMQIIGYTYLVYLLSRRAKKL